MVCPQQKCAKSSANRIADEISWAYLNGTKRPYFGKQQLHHFLMRMTVLTLEEVDVI
jgi:hypothetical protein